MHKLKMLIYNVISFSIMFCASRFQISKTVFTDSSPHKKNISSKEITQSEKALFGWKVCWHKTKIIWWAEIS